MITKKKIKAAGITLLAVYVIIFGVRLAYDFSTYEDPFFPSRSTFSNYSYDSIVVSNYATLRKEYTAIAAGSIEVLEQKYEQVATITAKTTSFDDDLNNLNEAIEQAQAVIQREIAQGLTGNRSVTRIIGVKPQYFQSCLEAVKKVGVLVSSTSQTNDKTYEYRQMLAQRQEMEKRLDSYTALREHSGSINEMLNLEDKIIEVESMLLQQAVDLGEYSDDNALCTINFSLYEGNPMNVGGIIWGAFLWATACYFAILGGVVSLCIAAVVLIKAFTFFSRIFNTVVKKKLIKEE